MYSKFRLGSYRRERLVETKSIVVPHKEADLVQKYSDGPAFYEASEHNTTMLCNSKYVQYISIVRRLIQFSNATGMFTSRRPESAFGSVSERLELRTAFEYNTTTFTL